jgi:serine/threonine-protein kinase RsbW
VFAAGSATEMHSEGTTVDPTNPIVEFCMPADPQYVRVARLVAGDMAERAGFSVDELDDVRLAVDELCAILINVDGSPLELRMQALGGELVIKGKTPGARAPAVPSELSEMLLRALVDSCTFDTSEHETSVMMRKQARDIP